MKRRMNPKQETIAFRAWCHCETHGWDMTVADLAAELDVKPRALQLVVNLKGWQNRFRVAQTRKDNSKFLTYERPLDPFDGMTVI